MRGIPSHVTDIRKAVYREVAKMAYAGSDYSMAEEIPYWEKYFQHICEKYNKIYKVQMPKVTPHVCRHTFCSNMAKSGMNPKTLQYIMGHADISVTLNVCTHVQFDDAQEELLKVAQS